MQKQSLQGARVLVVDDNGDTRELLALVLGIHGVTVAEAETGAEALKALGRERFDALICDIGLPGEDGYTLLRRIRRLPEEAGGRIPAIALTGYVSEEDREEAREAGFQLHLVKPIDPEVIAGLLLKLLRDDSED